MISPLSRAYRKKRIVAVSLHKEYAHYMNRTVASIILIGFAAIAVFGFAAMGGPDMNMDGHSGCIATLGQSVLCSNNDAFVMINTHAQLFQQMTSAASFGFLLVLALFVIFAWMDRGRLLAQRAAGVVVIRRRLLNISYALHRLPFLSWLILTEKVGPVIA